MESVISSIFWGIVVLGVLVTIHEFGHFIVAKLCGVKVLKFSIGFGRRLFGFKWGETDYFVSLVPLGGYVKMLGEEDFTDEFEGGEGKGDRLKKEDIPPEDYARSFMAQSVPKRMLISAAGPVFNIVLAVFMLWALFMFGVDKEVFEVGYVVPESPAAQAGFMMGDVIEKAGDDEIASWEHLAAYAKENAGKTLGFLVRRGDEDKTIKADLAENIGRDGMGLFATVFVGPIFENSPADKAGLHEGDRLMALDGRPIESWAEFVEVIKSSANKVVNVTIRRDGETMTLPVTPEPPGKSASLGGPIKKLLVWFGLASDEPEPVPEPAESEAPGKIGIMWRPPTTTVYLGPVEAMDMSLRKTAEMGTVIVHFLGELLSGKRDATELGGPITIAQMSGKYAKKGPKDFVFFMALLSVNLGIINLVPIPILDGGMIFFLMIEGIMGRPLDMKKREFIQMVGLVIIVALFVLVFYVDILRMFGEAPNIK